MKEKQSASPNNDGNSADEESGSAGISHHSEIVGDHEGILESTQPTTIDTEPNYVESFQSRPSCDESRTLIDDDGSVVLEQDKVTDVPSAPALGRVLTTEMRLSVVQQLFDDDDDEDIDIDIDSWDQSNPSKARDEASQQQREESLLAHASNSLNHNHDEVPTTLPGAFHIGSSTNPTAPPQQSPSSRIDQDQQDLREHEDTAERGLNTNETESIASMTDDAKVNAPGSLPVLQRELTKEMRQSVVENMLDDEDLLEYCESDGDIPSGSAKNDIESAGRNIDEVGIDASYNNNIQNRIVNTANTNERFSLSNLRGSNANVNINVTRDSNSYVPRLNGSFLSDVTISKEFGRDDDDGTTRSVRLSGQYSQTGAIGRRQSSNSRLRNSDTGNTVSAHPVDAFNVEEDEVFRQQLASAMDQAREQIVEEVQAAMLSNVVVGQVVDDHDTDRDAGRDADRDVRDTELPSFSNEGGQAEKGRYALLICICVLCILVAVGAAVGIALGSSSGDSDDSSSSSNFDITGMPSASTTSTTITTTPSVILSMPPSSYPTATISQSPSAQPTQSELTTILYPLSGQLLDDDTTPQYAAFRWLIEEDTIIDEIILNNDTNSEKDVRDRYVAVLLYFSLGGDLWSDASSYLDPQSHICFWSRFGNNIALFGIFCQAPEQSSPVTTLYFNGYNLQGTIPDEIQQFSTLVQVFMSRNRIQGTLPESIGRLTELIHLELFDNQFTGTIPVSVGHIPKLDTILLFRNNFRGPIPTFEGNMGALRKLVIQSFECNEFTGHFENIMASIQNPLFEEFFCACCNLTGTIPIDHLKRFTKLRHLVATNGQISGPIPTEIGLLIDLMTFKAIGNSLTGTIPTEIGMNLQLVDFLVNKNQLVGTIPSVVGMLPKLRWFEVHYNNLFGTIPEFGLNADSLQTLILADDDDGNNFSVDVNTLFSSLPKASFRRIHCIGCSLNGTLPGDIGTYSVFQDIQLTSGEDSPGLTGTIPTEIGLLKSLFAFRVSNNSLTGEIPTEVGLLEPLVMKEFRVANNDLRGTIPSELGMLRGLVSLEIQGNEDLVGDLTWLFCPLLNPSIDLFASDCGVSERVTCDCCNECY